jgi:hypothetical protein
MEDRGSRSSIFYLLSSILDPRRLQYLSQSEPGTTMNPLDLTYRESLLSFGRPRLGTPNAKLKIELEEPLCLN